MCHVWPTEEHADGWADDVETELDSFMQEDGTDANILRYDQWGDAFAQYARPLIVVNILDFSRKNRGLQTRVYCLNFGL